MGVGKRKAGEPESNAQAGTSTGPDPGLKRHKKDENVEPTVEKRLARFKPRCPQNIMDRVQRVMSQRFFLIDRQRTEGQLKEEFKVLGSTGNVYTVIIDKLPSCNCPDATKGNHCKHILFIFLKVLSLPMSSSLYYQKALLTTELETLFASAPTAPNSLVHPRIQAAYAKATGRTDDGATTSESNVEGDQKTRRLPGEGDDCPICYESMHNMDIKTLTFCNSCGNALHTECFRQWARTANPLTCVWCRARWPTVAEGDGATTSTDEGYLNLSAAAGLSPVRDTSSYYSGSGYWGRSGYRRSYGS